MKDFAHRIKALRAEIEALKAVKSKSSTSLKTIRKEVSCSAQIMRTQATPLGPGTLFTKYMALVELVPTDQTTPFIFCASQPAFADRGNRFSYCYGWMASNGNPAILVDPGYSTSDEDLASGGSRTINLKIYITATADFTTNVSQILYTTRTP